MFIIPWCKGCIEKLFNINIRKQIFIRLKIYELIGCWGGGLLEMLKFT